jgi:putative DNA primase/helicase
MTLTEFLTRFDDVEHDADGVLVTCPHHADSKPSLRISVGRTGKVLMKCRAGCETADVLADLGMTMTDLVDMKPGDIDFRPATSTAMPATPTQVASLAMQLQGYASTMFDETASGAADAFAYARDRFGLSVEDIQRLGLGYSEDQGGPRLVVPFRTPDGVPRNFQGRALDPDAKVRWRGPHSPDGASWSPLGYFPGGNGWAEVVICEGPGDALTAAAAGYDTIGVAGAGRVNTPAIVEEIRAWVGDRPAVVAGDGDSAGRAFSAKLAAGLSALGVQVTVLNMADGVDLNDWRLADRAKFQGELIRAVQQTVPLRTKDAALAEWDEERYSLTDLGGARFLRDFITGQGSGVRYNEETGFYVLDGGVWRRDERQRVRTYAQGVADLLRDLARTASFDSAKDGAEERDKKRAGRLNRYAAHAQTSKGLDAMIRELQAVKGVPIRLDEFDRQHHLLAFMNGVVDLRSGDLLPHDPDLLLTRRVEYNYNAFAKAPRWLKFLREVFPNHAELPAYIQRLTGYGITGSTDEQCLVVHYGKGGNGKSVLTEVLTELFRDVTVTTPFSTFEQKPSGGIPNDLAALNGARLVFATEGEQGKVMAEALLKRLTGRDMISARFMRKEFFEFRPTFLIQLSTNNKPNFRGQDEGLWRRVKLIPWERNFTAAERDPKLNLKLLDEAEGIIAWAVAGAVEWYKRGTLDDPKTIQDATAEYRETSNALDGFIPGVFVADSDNGSILGQTVFDSYLAWADEENLSPREVWTRRTLFGALEERGFTKKKGAKGIVFDGLRRPRKTDYAPEWAAEIAPDHSPLTTTEGTGSALKGADLADL